MRARIIIADDHLVVRQGLRSILSGSDELEVIAEVEDGASAERMARTVSADLLILDIGLPLRRGVEVCQRLRADSIFLPILFFSMYPPSQYNAVARKIGAQGFLGKDSTSASILNAVAQVLMGQTYFSDSDRALGADARESDPFACLSPRETQVLRGLVLGQSLTDQSRQMGINIKTLSTYRARILGKLGKTSNADLIALSLTHGFK